MVTSSVINNKKIYSELLNSGISVVSWRDVELKQAFIFGFKSYYIKERYFDPEAFLEIDGLEYKIFRTKVFDRIEEYYLKNKLNKDSLLYVLIDNFDYVESDSLISKIKKEYAGVKLILLVSREVDFENEVVNKVDIRNILFEDYLQLKNIIIDKGNFHLVEQYFEEFLVERGKVSSVVVLNILYRIVAEKGLKDSRIIFGTYSYLVKRMGVVSINKMAKELRISPDTASRYMKYVREYFICDIAEKGRVSGTVYKHPSLFVQNISNMTVGSHLAKEFFGCIYHLMGRQKVKYHEIFKDFVGLVINGKILIIPNYKKMVDFDVSKMKGGFDEIYEVFDLESIYLFLDKMNNAKIKK